MKDLYREWSQNPLLGTLILLLCVAVILHSLSGDFEKADTKTIILVLVLILRRLDK